MTKFIATSETSTASMLLLFKKQTEIEVNEDTVYFQWEDGSKFHEHVSMLNSY
jgi:hypothetical protein